jgi:hypothetical protein
LVPFSDRGKLENQARYFVLRLFTLTFAIDFITTFPTAVQSHRLASAVAARLAEVVPSSLSVRSDGLLVNVYRKAEPTIPLGGSAAAQIISDDDGRSLPEKARVAVASILNGVQDCVAEELAEPWPQVSGKMAQPNARTDGERVYLWYGDVERFPVISLAPIRLAEL